MNTILRKTIVRVSLAVLTTLAIVPMAWGQFAFTTNNGAITITGYNTAAGLNAVIPTSTNGYPVVSIGNYAFQSSSVTNVTIPGSVTNIGYEAFYNCSGLTSVTIPNSVTDIREAAFAYCSGLTSVAIGNSVTNIGGGTFGFCDSLTNIAVDVSNPNYSSFNGVLFDKAQTTLIIFPPGLGGRYTIPNSVTSIANGAFFNCTSLTSVTIPNSVTSIGTFAFSRCSSLTSVTMGNRVTAIGYETFSHCTSLTSVTIPNSVTYIGNAAFSDCTSLTSVTIPNSVTSIENYYAFYNCTNLTAVYFLGNAPAPNNDSTAFSLDPATIFYLPGTSGWGSTFDSRPTALWYLPTPLILTGANGNNNLGIRSNRFGFTLSWATNLQVVVEACTNLANPIWTPLATNALVSGTNYFSDPTPPTLPQRIYRVRPQ